MSASQVACRDAQPDEIPRGARTVAAAAEQAGWRVRCTYARGVYTFARKPAAVVDSVAVRMRQDRRAAVAIWLDGRFDTAFTWSADEPFATHNARSLRAALTATEPTPRAPLDDPPATWPRSVVASPTIRPGTWGAVHVDDVVRAADQRGWRVIERGATALWASGVAEATFRLRRDGRTVTARRQLREAVDVMHRADHHGEAAGFNALSSAGFDIEIIEETIVDQFQAPAPLPVKRDRHGRYMLPDPESGQERSWTRVTTLARTLADEYGLNQWAKRMVAKGIATRPDLTAGAAAADVNDRATLNSIVKQAEEAAGAKSGGNLGTALHNFTQRLDRGEPLSRLGAPAPLDADLAAYVGGLKLAKLTAQPEYVERIVVAPELGVAGTFDRLVSGPGVDGLAVFDLKSAKDVSYSWLEIAIQLACYAHATHMWDPAAEQYLPMPNVDRHRGLVMHLPVGKAHAQVYGVDLIKGWAFAQLASSVRSARSEARNLSWLVKPDDQSTLALHHVSRAASREELAALWDRLHPKGLWTEEVNSAAITRATELATTSATATVTV